MSNNIENSLEYYFSLREKYGADCPMWLIISLDRLEKENTELKDKLIKATAALEFYANEKSYWRYSGDGNTRSRKAASRMTVKARQALKELVR